MKKKSELLLGILRVPSDFIGVYFAFIIAYILRLNYPNFLPWLSLSSNLAEFQPWPEYLLFASVSSLVLVIVNAFSGLYSFNFQTAWHKEIGKVILSTSTWLIILISYFFIVRDTFFSRLVLGYSFIFSIILISLFRSLIKILEKILLCFGIGKNNILIIGANQNSKNLHNYFSLDRRYNIFGEDNFNAIDSIQKLEEIVKKNKIDEIIQTSSERTAIKSLEILNFCKEKRIQYSFIPDLINLHQKNIEIALISGIPVISLKATSLDGWGRVIKRIFDLVLSFPALVILSPFFLIISLAIKLNSKGTIMFKYLDDNKSIVKRVGENGKLFRLYKFRTMFKNTHNLRYTQLNHLNTRQGSPLVKIKNDPRITKVGRFLRKYSLDELPQLWNVFLGNMSLVGPRPHLPEEVDKYNKEHKFALTIKPGITGLAQISGRSDLKFEEEMKLDRYYIENWSLWQDIKILFKTIKVIFRKYESE